MGLVVFSTDREDVLARLRVTKSGSEIGTVELTDKDVRLGRAPENDLVLEDSGTAVSRYHAELRTVGDLHILVNLSQPFGVWAAGQRVERVVMAPGVAVTVGPYVVQVEQPVAAAQVPPVAQPPAAVSASNSAAQVPGAIGATQGTGASEPLHAAASVVAPAVALASGAAEVSAVSAEATAPARSHRSTLTNWLVAGAVAAGLIAVVALAQMISPSTLTRPAPVEASSNTTPPPVVASEDALRAQLESAREAIDRGQSTQALRDLESVLTKAPSHAEALALKARAEERLTAAKTPVAAGSPAANVTSAAGAAPPASVGGERGAPPRAERAGGAAGTAPMTAATTTKPLLQRPGTKDPAYAGRNSDVVRRYLQAETAYKDGQYRLAISNLQSVLRSDSTFPNAEAKLDEVKSTVRTMAEAAFAEGGRLEKSGEFQGAIRSYERSQEIATMMYGVMNGVDEAVARVRQTMVATGSDAFKKARQYDALGRASDAVPLYSKAVELLPQDDPNRQLAQERLGALKR